MKKIFARISVILLFLVGLSFLLYPLIANEWNAYRQEQLMTSYEENIAELNEGGDVDFEEEWKKARDYNNLVLPTILPDPFAVAAVAKEPDERYLSCLNIGGDGIMGIIEIPQIEVKLPIAHTAKEEVLEEGAGHLEGSSLPIGGEGTHAIITAHRGLPSAALFTDLDQLEIGDYFLIKVLDETLCYQVREISIVEPQDIDILDTMEGEDLVTLITCTPYGVNSHRLIVTGERTAYEPEVIEKVESQNVKHSIHTNYLLWVIVGIAVVGVVIILFALRERSIRRRISNEKEQE